MYENPLDSIVFITIPEHFSAPKEALRIDTAIPLPVQCLGSGSQTPDLTNLSWEMILAGILTVLAYDEHNKHADYYRELLLAVKPDIKRELAEAAILKARNEDFDIAEEIFAALRGLDPQDTAIILNSALFFDQRADSYRKSGLTEEADACDARAFQFYKQVMSADPPAPDAFFNAGFFFLKQKNFSRARSVFETYLSLIPDAQDTEENSLYKKARAQEIVDDISSRNLDDELFKAAYDFIRMGEEEKGLEHIRQFLQNNPKVWNAWFMLGWGLRRLNRWEDAKAAFLQAIACDGENTDTCNELAICFMELNDFINAKKQLLRALSFENENTKVMSNLGILALKTGNPSEARRYFLSVLEFDPDDAIAKKALEDLDG